MVRRWLIHVFLQPSLKSLDCARDCVGSRDLRSLRFKGRDDCLVKTNAVYRFSALLPSRGTILQPRRGLHGKVKMAYIEKRRTDETQSRMCIGNPTDWQTASVAGCSPC